MRSAPLVLVLTLLSVLLGGCPDGSDAKRDAEASATFVLRAEEAVEQLIDGDFAAIRSDFDETMLEELPEEELSQVFADVEAQWGELEGQEGAPEVVQREEFTVVNVPVRFEERSAQIRVTFRDDGKIAGFFILRPGVPVP